MANKSDYLKALKDAIRSLHGCRAEYLNTVHVTETFKGKAVWDGDVEVFGLLDHPKAHLAYAWARLEGANDETTKFTAVLELPPVKDAKTAVQASIMADGKRATK